jgi:hypothetical protein
LRTSSRVVNIVTALRISTCVSARSSILPPPTRWFYASFLRAPT